MDTRLQRSIRVLGPIPGVKEPSFSHTQGTGEKKAPPSPPLRWRTAAPYHSLLAMMSQHGSAAPSLCAGLLGKRGKQGGPLYAPCLLTPKQFHHLPPDSITQTHIPAAASSIGKDQPGHCGAGSWAPYSQRSISQVVFGLESNRTCKMNRHHLPEASPLSWMCPLLQSLWSREKQRPAQAPELQTRFLHSQATCWLASGQISYTKPGLSVLGWEKVGCRW